MPTLSRKSLLEFLYSSIVSAIGNVVDFMVGTSELNQANGKAQALLMAHIHLSQALGKGLGSLFFFDH